MREIDQSGGIDVDIIKTGQDGLSDQIPDRLRLPLPLRREPLGVYLKMISLQEDRASPAGLDSCRQHSTGILQGPLPGVAYLRTGDLKDNRPCIPLLRRPKHCLRHIVGKATDIDRWNGKSTDLAFAHGLIQGLDGCRNDPQTGRSPANQKCRYFLNR